MPFLRRNIVVGVRYINQNGQRSRTNIIKLNDKTKHEKEKTNAFTPGSLGLLILPATAFGLGVWQVQRLKWKEDLIKELKGRVSHEAIEFPFNNLDVLDQLEYRKVKVKGRFLYEKEFVIAPRGRFDEGFKDPGQGLMSSSQSSSHGGHFVTPFQIDGTDKIIMINRGWLPTTELQNEKTRKRDGKTVEIEAIVRKTEPRPQFVGANKPEQNIWFYKNFKEMGDSCGALPILLDKVYDPKASIHIGPIGGQTNINLRNDHLSYLVTWFSLSGVTFLMWFHKFLRKK